VYKGDWVEDEKSGKGNSYIKLLGVHILPNKDKYDGEWKNGKKEGSGRLFC